MYTLNDVKKYIQGFFDSNTLLIVGSGLSMAEGIPGMSKLSEELREKVPLELKSKNDIEAWEIISDKLNHGMSLEKCLLQNSVNESTEAIIKKVTHKFIKKFDYKLLNDIISNEKKLKLSRMLTHFPVDSKQINVITTNYDRLVEYACESQGLMINTSFWGNTLQRFNPNGRNEYYRRYRQKGTNVQQYTIPYINVLKPHGCLSWYKYDDYIYANYNSTIGTPCIITPGTNKYKSGYSSPFDFHREESNKIINSSSKYIFIGYGFNDDHLETHIRNKKNLSKPILILTRDLTHNAKSLVIDNPEIMAVSLCGENDTLIQWQGEDCILPNVCYWDIEKLIKEVF